MRHQRGPAPCRAFLLSRPFWLSRLGLSRPDWSRPGARRSIRSDPSQLSRLTGCDRTRFFGPASTAHSNSTRFCCTSVLHKCHARIHCCIATACARQTSCCEVPVSRATHHFRSEKNLHAECFNGHAHWRAWNLRPLRHTRFALIANSSGELRVLFQRRHMTQLQN